MTHPTLQRLLGAGLLLAAQALSPSAHACRYTELAALDINIQAASGMPYVEGQVNGKTVRMLVDTGSARTLLTRAEMDRQQLPLTRTLNRVRGMGGDTAMFAAQPEEVIIGPSRVAKAWFPVVDGFDYPGYGGMVGADYLLQSDLEIALAERKLKFFKEEGCSAKSLAYWDTQALDVPLELSDQHSAAYVQVQLNGRPLRALIDTGAEQSVVDLATAAALGVSTTSQGVSAAGDGVGVAGKPTPHWRAGFDSFAIGEENIGHPQILLAEIPNTQQFGIKHIDMILGRDFLRAHRVLLAASQQRFYYSYLGGQVFGTR
ncbi:retroviral-like aspartic protease family protein [Duganella sp. S19_KUP01_CR8]|uniref:retroviral-like aspartic protease family protein n=1 Tax=Duganella sp. S19_KUP01_CR8 TaxID=3025502 RepID=UPI002FCD6F36